MLRSFSDDHYQTPTEVALHSLGLNLDHGCSFLLSEHLIGNRLRSGMTQHSLAGHVTASPNPPIPFMVASSLNAGAMNNVEISAATAFSVASAQTLRFTTGPTPVMMPGANAQFTFAGAPDELKLGFSRYPAMLLVSILDKTFDVAGSWVTPFSSTKSLRRAAPRSFFDTLF